MRSKRFFGPYRYARNTAKLPSFSSPAPRAISARSRGEKNAIAKKTFFRPLSLRSKHNEAHAVFFLRPLIRSARDLGEEKTPLRRKRFFGPYFCAPAVFFFPVPDTISARSRGGENAIAEKTLLRPLLLRSKNKEGTAVCFVFGPWYDQRAIAGRKKRHCEENAISAPTATFETEGSRRRVFF